MRNVKVILPFIMVLLVEFSCYKVSSDHQKEYITFTGLVVGNYGEEKVSISPHSSGNIYLKYWNDNFSTHYVGVIKGDGNIDLFYPQKIFTVEKCKNQKKGQLAVSFMGSCSNDFSEPQLLVSENNSSLSKKIFPLDSAMNYWEISGDKKIEIKLTAEFDFEYEHTLLDVNYTMICVTCEPYQEKLEIEVMDNGVRIKGLAGEKLLMFLNAEKSI